MPQLINPQWLEQTRQAKNVTDDVIVKELIKANPEFGKRIEAGGGVDRMQPNQFTELLDKFAQPEKEPVAPQEQQSFAAKTASNILPSAGQFAKDVGSFFMNAFDFGDFTDEGFEMNLQENSIANTAKLAGGAIKNTYDTLQDVTNKGVTAAGNAILGTDVDASTFNNTDLKIPGLVGSEDMASQVGQFLNDRYGISEVLDGDIEGAQTKIAETISTDPVGFAADLAGLLAGGAGLAGKAMTGTKAGAAVSRAGKVANALDPINLATKTITSSVAPIKQLANSTSKFVVSNVTGLNPKTISTILTHGDDVGGKSVSRLSLAEKIKTGIDKLDTELDDIGKAYDPVRKMDGVVELPESFWSDALQKTGLTIEDGVIRSALSDSTQLSKSELSQVQKFFDENSNIRNLTGKEFMGMRKRLSNLAKFEMQGGASANVRNVFKQLRKQLNKNAPNLLRGIDNEFSPKRKQLDQLKSDFLNPDGTLKDSSLNKAANLDGKGRDLIYGRIKEIMPELETELNILKAIEDIDYAQSGKAVGTYVRAGLGLASASSGFVPGIISAILLQPVVVSKLITYYGKSTGKATNKLKQAIKHGEKLTPDQSSLLREILESADATLKETGVLTERSQEE